MFARFFRGDRKPEGSASDLYGAIVTQARSPVFYAHLGVPDTVTGRFEMVVLHSVLVIDRLKRAGVAGKARGQEVFDAFCRDMDQSLRELGFGDQAVPKRMKRLGEGFYGRAEAYARSFGDRAGIVAAIGRNVFADAPGPSAADALAAYAMDATEKLTSIDDGDLLAGRVTFPDPSAYAPAGAEA